MELSSVDVKPVLFDVAYDRVLAKALADCGFVKKVLFGISGSHRFLLMCSLDKEHCPCRGKRVRFKARLDGLYVVWVCPKTVGLPRMES
jgi:hypothetical protein